jgi:hypothetical protein
VPVAGLALILGIDRFYEDAFVKPSLIAASGTPHEDGYRGMSACSRL